MAKPQSIREVVKAEMKRRELTAYALWKLVEGQVTKTTIYNYINGDAELTTGGLEHVLAALDIKLSSPK